MVVGIAAEGAEGAMGGADVGVVNVSVDDVSADSVAVEESGALIGPFAKFVERCAVIEVERLIGGETGFAVDDCAQPAGVEFLVIGKSVECVVGYLRRGDHDTLASPLGLLKDYRQKLVFFGPLRGGWGFFGVFSGGRNSHSAKNWLSGSSVEPITGGVTRVGERASLVALRRRLVSGAVGEFSDRFVQPARVCYGDLATGKCWIECASSFAFQRDDGVCNDCGCADHSHSGVGVRIVYGGSVYAYVGYGRRAVGDGGGSGARGSEYQNRRGSEFRPDVSSGRGAPEGRAGNQED